MELDWIWKSILIVLVSIILLRIAGRKTISQMTLAETVIMIAIGSLLIQPVAGKNLWITFGVGLTLVLTLIVINFGQLKSDALEKLVTGKSKPVIENGTINQKNLTKLRLTVDQLEMNLRQKNVTKLSDVEWATLEPNGQVGFTLKNESLPATKKDVQRLQESINHLHSQASLIDELNVQISQLQQDLQNKSQQDIFTEVKNASYQNPPPKKLQ